MERLAECEERNRRNGDCDQDRTEELREADDRSGDDPPRRRLPDRRRGPRHPRRPRPRRRARNDVPREQLLLGRPVARTAGPDAHGPALEARKPPDRAGCSFELGLPRRRLNVADPAGIHPLAVPPREGGADVRVTGLASRGHEQAPDERLYELEYPAVTARPVP